MTSGFASSPLLLSALLLALPARAVEPPLIEESNGVIAFEAESGVGEWSIVDSATGSAIQDPGHGGMRYTLRFRQPGKYYVFLLARQGPLGKDKENDVKLLLGGEKLWASDGTSRPDGMRSNGGWKWTHFPKGPGAHTPRSFFRDPVYFVVDQPGDLTLEILHRSANYAIDRVMLKRDDPSLPALPPEIPPEPPKKPKKEMNR